MFAFLIKVIYNRFIETNKEGIMKRKELEEITGKRSLSLKKYVTDHGTFFWFSNGMFSTEAHNAVKNDSNYELVSTWTDDVRCQEAYMYKIK
jgi:hypothetical protein